MRGSRVGTIPGDHHFRTLIAERSCTCKELNCPAVGGGSEVTFKPLVPKLNSVTRQDIGPVGLILLAEYVRVVSAIDLVRSPDSGSTQLDTCDELRMGV
ncbi:hypothetical protein J6590_086729 [Homalodisca vitripennis]|nr:hypothetical protein J6590_086729 [Homalodisca vitripennis]